MPTYTIKHITRYSYASMVIDCTNQVMLYPLASPQLEVRKHDLTISHNPLLETFTDYFGNQVGVFSVIKPHNELLIESNVSVITKPITLPADDMPAAEQWKMLDGLKQRISHIDFLKQEFFDSWKEVKHVLSEIVSVERTPFQNAVMLSEYVYNNFSYQKGITNVESKTEEVWKLKAGVCQDFAHILLVFLRMFEIPARYVSGYICPKDKEMRGEGATHAWVECFLPNYGWIGLDPTNNCIVNDQHVHLAVGRSFTDCTPVKGTYKGSGEHTLEVSVEIKNGTPKKAEKAGLPKFGYEAKNPGEQQNSYRNFLAMQQQQQQ